MSAAAQRYRVHHLLKLEKNRMPAQVGNEE
jgi:hypothetical protein